MHCAIPWVPALQPASGLSAGMTIFVRPSKVNRFSELPIEYGS
jgi:hypothetical protein